MERVRVVVLRGGQRIGAFLRGRSSQVLRRPAVDPSGRVLGEEGPSADSAVFNPEVDPLDDDSRSGAVRFEAAGDARGASVAGNSTQFSRTSPVAGASGASPLVASGRGTRPARVFAARRATTSMRRGQGVLRGSSPMGSPAMCGRPSKLLCNAARQPSIPAVSPFLLRPAVMRGGGRSLRARPSRFVQTKLRPSGGLNRDCGMAVATAAVRVGELRADTFFRAGCGVSGPNADECAAHETVVASTSCSAAPLDVIGSAPVGAQDASPAFCVAPALQAARLSLAREGVAHLDAPRRAAPAFAARVKPLPVERRPPASPQLLSALSTGAAAAGSSASATATACSAVSRGGPSPNVPTAPFRERSLEERPSAFPAPSNIEARTALKRTVESSRPAPAAGRAVKHSAIRPAMWRCGSTLSEANFDRVMAADLVVDAIPVREKAMRERIRRMRRQGITIGTIFNTVTGLEERRLLDKHGRMIVKDEEVVTVLTYLWEEGNRMDTNHTLRRRAQARFSGLGAEKVEHFLAQQVNSSVRNFKVPFVQQPKHIVASRPLQHIQIDCTHLHSVTYLGSVVTGVISFIDIFSRYIFAWPIIAECSWEVCRAFIWFCSLYGAPEIVQTDHGTAFLGEMKAMAEQVFGCRVIHGRVRYPQSQGTSEKSHGKLKNCIIELTFEHLGDILRWPEMVPLACLATRARNLLPHSLFNEELCPFTVFFGRPDNCPLAADVRLLNGTFEQTAARVQTLAEKQQARLAGRVNIDHYVDGSKSYDVELCFQGCTESGDPEDRFYTLAGQEVQRVVDLASSQTVVPRNPRIAYTEYGVEVLRESSTAIREILEVHRACGEALLRKRFPAGQSEEDLSDILRGCFCDDSSTRQALEKFAHFSTGIREAAAQFTVAYLESVDTGTRKRMPAPYQLNDPVWVDSLSEDGPLCRKYKTLWTSQTNRRLRQRLPGVIRSVDTQNVNRPYEVEVFVDGVRALEEGRTVCELVWLSGAALVPQSTFLKKLRSYGNLEQVPGLCVARITPTLYCLRTAADNCQRALCEIHCKESPEGSCGAHRHRASDIFILRTD